MSPALLMRMSMPPNADCALSARACYLVAVGHVGLHDDGGAPLAFDVVSKRLEPLDAAGGEGDPRAGAGEGAGGGFADAAGGAGDDSGLTVEGLTAGGFHSGILG